MERRNKGKQTNEQKIKQKRGEGNEIKHKKMEEENGERDWKRREPRIGSKGRRKEGTEDRYKRRR